MEGEAISVENYKSNMKDDVVYESRCVKIVGKLSFSESVVPVPPPNSFVSVLATFNLIVGLRAFFVFYDCCCCAIFVLRQCLAEAKRGVSLRVSGVTTS
ncbi:hypothetical protein OUZ56_022631 [Daphnia magna]|uniref:Uncharacterized protein n=1 Tax=Daphnia magna TaxID=35525 RepID=A0ABR0AWZ6_9CRUS|nr:hypothetical protein OUZ56_022631 [Daphnia magna]